jgi:outer membrane lipoprotein-sorting protein
MDTASTKFKSAQADLSQVNYERVVKETTTSNGSVYFKRNGNSTEMGLQLNPPNTRIIEFKNGVARIFDPGADHLTTIAAAQYESYLTLGFGGSGSDLKKSWNITDQGPETINGVATEKLDLVAKDPGARTNFSHITIWIDPTRAISMKMQTFTPSGDYKIATYTNIRYNPKSIDTKPYAIKTDKNTTYDRH